MKRQKPKHWILDHVSDDDFNRLFQIADNRILYYSLKDCCKIDNVNDVIYDLENKEIKNIIDLLEMVIIDLNSDYETNNYYSVREVYQQIFYLSKVLPIPSNEIDKIKFIYRIISYSYLSEKWESGRRYIIENADECLVEVYSSDTWDLRVFKNTYMAFLYLVKKSSWKDLNKACNYIKDLREDQKVYEKSYLSELRCEEVEGRVHELIGLYHFAKTIELMCEFMVNGKSPNIREQIDFHFEKAINSTEYMDNLEMNIILTMLRSTIKQMISNSIWMVTDRVDSRISKFVRHLTSSNKPIFELLYPQKYSVLEKGLLDPAHKAVVVNLPTSSGKTLLSEFRILQALNQFSDEGGWVAYVAPTKALVNQITSRLKRDLSSIGVSVEKMSGAIEIDTFEENILTSKNNMFDILVVTPEKLNLLIRDNMEKKVGRPLALVVVDEAHNIEDPNIGLTLELLMSNIKNDCYNANFLLLTPFIPNSKTLAKWLDPDSPNEIQLQLSWQPNDRIIGAFYPEGKAQEWNTIFETLMTSNEQIQIDRKLIVGESNPIKVSRSSLSKKSLTAAITKQLINRKGILTICMQRKHCWDCAKMLAETMPTISKDPDIELVKRYIASELGEDFILLSLLDKGIGVHHSGLPEEVKYLMEWLMENEKLIVLVSTTTIAQGINFPVTTVLMASYSYPYVSEMPTRDFWNLVGRVGRTEQSDLGIIGIAIGDKEKNKQSELIKLSKYLSKSTKDLISNLVKMVDQAIDYSDRLNLSKQYYKPEWSQFLQYITHMFNQCKNLDEFNINAELFLRRTYGYSFLTPKNKNVLLKSVVEYGETLNEHKGLAKLCDSTGFSMEAINITMNKVKELNLDKETWKSSNLFNNDGKLKNLMGVMLSIPDIKKSLEDIKGTGNIPGDTLAQITMDWVSGRDIEDIARQYFKGNNYSSITDCCNAIYSKLINSATWGLASIQKIPNSGIDFESLSLEEKRKLSNLPAMIYYGIDTDEGILMRMNSIPRSIASNFASKYASMNEDVYSASPADAYNWISSLSSNDWNTLVGDGRRASGSDYKRIWKILNGQQ